MEMKEMTKTQIGVKTYNISTIVDSENPMWPWQFGVKPYKISPFVFTLWRNQQFACHVLKCYHCKSR